MADRNVIRFDKEAYYQKLIEQGYTSEQAMTIADQYDKTQQDRPKETPKKPVNLSPINKRLNDYLAQEEEDAKQSGTIGYMARALVQASMPHSRVKEYSFERRNGDFYIWMSAPPRIGLPYGSVPRLVMSWMTTEAVRTKSRILTLGESLSGFLANLGLSRTGGTRGDITRLKDQMKRLLSCAITCTYDNGKRFSIENVTPVESAALWWDPINPEQIAIWESTITLSPKFFEEITSSPVPLRLKTLEALRNSSMALDVYCWLTYKNFYARHPSRIPWEALQMQFGAGYPETTRGKRNFKQNFLLALKKIGSIYPEAQKLQAETDVLVFIPGYPDVSPIVAKD
jgi:hypothetical protein